MTFRMSPTAVTRGWRYVSGSVKCSQRTPAACYPDRLPLALFVLCFYYSIHFKLAEAKAQYALLVQLPIIG